MDWMPVVFVAGIGLLLGILLTVASVVFAVQTDEQFDQVRSCLPGINCSACGYPNCDSYAKGILDGDVINKCRPGGKKTLEKLQQIFPERS